MQATQSKPELNQCIAAVSLVLKPHQKLSTETTTGTQCQHVCCAAMLTVNSIVYIGHIKKIVYISYILERVFN